MQISFTSLFSPVINSCALLTWRDFVEIAIVSWSVYGASVWLKSNRSTNLLAYFYGYLFFILTSYCANLSTLTSFLFFCSPIIAMLFMLMHEQVLQRNLVALKNITVHPSADCPDWLTILMKETLTLLTHNKTVFVIIEHTDAIGPYLNCQYTLDVPITQGLLKTLFSSAYHPGCYFWITSAGMVRNSNASFKSSWHDGVYKTSADWIDDAIAYSSKTDALIMHADAQHHEYSIVHNGVLTTGLMMQQAHTLIKKIIKYQIQLPKKGLSHGTTQQKKFAQPSP